MRLAQIVSAIKVRHTPHMRREVQATVELAEGESLADALVFLDQQIAQAEEHYAALEALNPSQPDDNSLAQGVQRAVAASTRGSKASVQQAQWDHRQAEFARQYGLTPDGHTYAAVEKLVAAAAGDSRNITQVVPNDVAGGGAPPRPPTIGRCM